MNLTSLVGALFLTTCARSVPILAPVDWNATPRLPSPSAGTYAQVPMDPPDPGVRQVIGGRKWDASLGGAAAGVALNLIHRRGELIPPEIREAAWRAGWPYPVQSVHTAGTTIGNAAPPKVKEQLASVPDGSSIGLVRARGNEQDLWVLLASTARVDVGTYPRQIARGSQIRLPSLPGVDFAVADPSGRLFEGRLDVGWSIETGTEGEWLVEMSDPAGVIARFPIYVGMVPPQLSLLSGGEVPANAKVASAQVQEALGSVREAYGLRPPQVDSLLQSAVAWAQVNRTLSAAAIGARVGFEAADIRRYDCTDSTVEICLDPLIWDPRARPVLFSGTLLLGIGAEIAPNGVHVTLLLARETAG